MTWVSVSGVHLSAAPFGAGEPLLLLHGFTGSAATWRYLRSIPYRCIAVDLPGHGGMASSADPAHYRMERTVAGLLTGLDALGLDRIHVLGYSMGGRVALHLALAAPGRVQSLILESASPGIEDPAERAARIQSDEVLAQVLDREGLEPFIDRWERIPLFASQTRLASEVRTALRVQRLAGSAAGLANSLRWAGAGRQAPLWERLDRLTMPVLLLAGELDEKYRAIASRMAAIMPHAEAVIVPDAGHAVHLEAPEVFKQELVRFLGDVAPHIPFTPTKRKA